MASKTDEELIALLPKSYDRSGDEAVGRGLRRMRWMNAIRNEEQKDNARLVIEYRVGNKWIFWAGADKWSVAERCKEMIQCDGTKARARVVTCR
ncbi:MAG: hypothetical protein Q8K86_08350 [Candidatus Nanopelagicaceae bacterium]|nr:hypothetical protein [Candidatus Nanopelagicaceae bacterium]